VQSTTVLTLAILLSCRCDHISVLVGTNKIYVTAGSGSEDLWYNDLYTLDLDSNMWAEQHPNTDHAPTPRDYTGAVAIANRVSQMWVWPTDYGWRAHLDAMTLVKGDINQ